MALCAATQIPNSRHASRQLVVAQQYCSACTYPVGPAQAPGEIARIAEIDRKTPAAQILGELQCDDFSGLSNRD